MKPFVVKCPIMDVNIIMQMPESVVVPPAGTIVYVECPCCRQSHEMRLWDAKRFRRAS
jgi:hypothetical protein